MSTESKSPFYRWSAKIRRDTLPEMQGLAASLGFIVDTPGRHDGEPATPKLLDALADAYRRDPAGVKLAFKVLGITPSGEASVTIGESEDAAAYCHDATAVLDALRSIGVVSEPNLGDTGPPPDFFSD